MIKKKKYKPSLEVPNMFSNGGYTTGPIATHADSVLNYKNTKAQEAAFKAIKMETIDLATFKAIRKMIKDKYPDDPRIENINQNTINYTSKSTLPTNHEYGVLEIRGEPPMPSIQSTPKPSPKPKPKPRPTTPSVTAPIIKAVDKIKSVVERPISTPQRQIVYGDNPPAPIVEDKPTGGYMDTRGVMMDKPQTAGNYTPEQLLKMGYRAKQSNVTLPNNKMKYGKGGSTDLSWFNQKLVQEANTRMNSTTKTTLGKTISTPQDRVYNARAKKLSTNPEKYTIQDYINGHKEEGLSNDVLSDPIAMAAALTAGGVGYGAVGLSQIPRMFGVNLLDEATFGIPSVGKSLLKSDVKGITNFIPKEVNYTEEEIRAAAARFHSGYPNIKDFEIMKKHNPSDKPIYSYTAKDAENMVNQTATVNKYKPNLTTQGVPTNTLNHLYEKTSSDFINAGMEQVIRGKDKTGLKNLLRPLNDGELQHFRNLYVNENNEAALNFLDSKYPTNGWKGATKNQFIPTEIQKNKLGGVVKMAKGGLLKGIGGALYGAVEGGLDAMSMGLTDQITDAGAKAIGGQDKTFNASRGAGNIAGAVGMDALTMGATHVGTIQQVAKGTNGLVQNTSIFGDKEKQGIGMGLQSFQALVPFLGAIEGGVQKQEQDGMNNTTINVEGSGIQSGQKASMKKGELLTSNGMVLRNFINIPPHPTDPNLINPDGTVQAPAGTTVIPKNRTKEYMERDLKGKQQLEKSLISAQRLRERKEAKMAKGGTVQRYDTNALVGPPTWNEWQNNNPVSEAQPGVFSDMDPTMSALNILPIAWKFGKGIFGKADHSNPEDYMVNARMKWNDLSNEQIQRKVNEGYNLGRYNMRNSGNYNLAGDVALGTNLIKTKAEEQEKIMNINAEGKFKADASNIDLMRSNMATKLTVDDMNAKNKAMKTDYINSGFEDIGKIGAFGLQKDYINNYMKKAYPRGYKKGGKE